MKKGGEWEEKEEEGWGGAKEKETSADEKGEWDNMEDGEGKSGVKKRGNEEGLPYSAAVFVWLYVDWWLSFLKDMLLIFEREREKLLESAGLYYSYPTSFAYCPMTSLLLNIL